MNKKPTELATGVYVLEAPFPPGFLPPDALGVTLCYLLEDDGGWLMVDSGFNDDVPFDSLCQQLGALGTSINDIRRLLITHFHPDHFGLAGRIKAASDAEVIMHQGDWEMTQRVKETANEWSLEQVLQQVSSFGVPPTELAHYTDVISFGRMLFPPGLVPDTVLKGDDEPVGGGGNLRAVLTPGHTPGHLCLYDGRNRFLFSGDHVLAGITTHISPGYLADDCQLALYLDALEKVRLMDVDMVLPAHEEPFADLGARVDEILQHHDQRLEQVLAALGDRPSSAWQIALQVDWTVGSWDGMDTINRLLAMMETTAHLELLQERGRVTLVEETPWNLYQLVNDW